jgi:hypothetical protein
MRSTWCIVWILGALVVIATLDALPDPPAVNPSTAICKALQLNEYFCDTGARCGDSLSTSYPLPVSFIAADADEPYRPSERMVLTGQMTDPSPPAARSRR